TVETFNITIDGTPYDKVTFRSGNSIVKLKVNGKVTAEVDVKKNKTVTVNLPKQLRDNGKTLSCDILTPGVCDVKYKNGNKSKEKYEIVPIDAGATYIKWSKQDGNSDNVAVAYTKVIVTKKITGLTVSQNMTLKVGEGKRITVTGTGGNTVTKALTFKVKGRGIKVSKSGYVTALLPGEEATVTVKSGKVSAEMTVNVEEYEGNYLTLNKVSVNVKRPKSTAKKPKTITLNLKTPKKKLWPEKLNWEIVGSPVGITIDEKGKVSVDSTASPGCYSAKVSAEGYNDAYCELIVQ
ncbi:MAG: hypothetical protein K6E33_02005, partial [Lachnospiraceae bacterium]|nr:hypothetical protein [Lachnospiraceae bacterium]